MLSQPILEIDMKDHISNAPRADQAIRVSPLNQFVLAPENVRRT